MRSGVFVPLRSGPRKMPEGSARDEMFNGHFANIKRRATGLDEQLTDRGRDHCRPAAVRKDVDALRVGAGCHRLQEALEVKDRELRRFGVALVAPQEAPGRTCRPGVGDRDDLAAEEVRQLRHTGDRILEGVVEPMHEDQHLLPGRVCEPTRELCMQELGLALHLLQGGLRDMGPAAGAPLASRDATALRGRIRLGHGR